MRLALAVVALGAGCKKAPEKASAAAPGVAPPAIAVEVAVARTDTVTDAIAATGQIEAVQSIELRPDVEGRILEILFRESPVVPPAHVTRAHVMHALEPRRAGREVQHVARSVNIDAHAHLARDREVVNGGEVIDLADVARVDRDRLGDVTVDKSDALCDADRTSALLRKRAELRLHEADRDVVAAREDPRQHLAA